ncbi:MAG: right-handed parallel beta-helix repeat-containing protein [Acidobacteriota bacterium]|nr:right-handed parallel beta-helix repeat-containing protein [Acidobacteriota bacterium]
MKRKTLIFVFIAILTLCIASMAQAQATRTWVSGVGDDVNPCSRTAPCKTFAGAISKTAAGGEISVLDPGGYGSVTITKAITINGTGTLAGILNAGTTGVIINAPATSNVVLRNLSIVGAGTGINGIRVLSAGEVYIQNCQIQNQAGDGIEISPSLNPAKVMVQQSSILNNTTNGIQIFPTGGATVKLTVEESDISGNNSNGIDVVGNTNTASVYNSRMTFNGANGLLVQLTSSTANIEGSFIAYNQTGVTSGLGGQSPVVRLSNNMIVGNTNNGVVSAGTGTQVGFFNNTIVDNGGDNTVSSSVAQQ